MIVKKFLLVGLGSIGKKHLSIIRSIYPSAEIVAVSSKAIEHFPDANSIIKSLAQIADFQPDYAIVASPSTNHLSDALLILEKTNAHVLIEKPLSTDFDDVLNFQSIIQNNYSTRCVGVGYNLRFSPALDFFKKIICSKYVGDIYAIDVVCHSYLPDWRPNEDYSRTVTARSDLGGGVLLELSHELDYLTWLFGTPKWISCFKGRFSNLNIDVDDCANLLIGYKAPSMNEFYCQLSLNFFSPVKQRYCTVIGSNGVVRLDLIKHTVSSCMVGDVDWTNLFSVSFNMSDTYSNQLISFMEWASGNGEGKVANIGEALTVMKIIALAEQSMSQNSQKIFFE